MKITKEIIQRIEGEATLELEWKKDKIDFARVKFLNYRAIETILQKRPLLDSLMITPRICGICSHSHVIASVKAIEDLYKNAGIEMKITPKARKIRELALSAEKIQNHIKWFYFTILPELFKLNGEKFAQSEPFRDKEWFEAQKAIKNIIKVSSVFCGQWPHGSFVMPGGVTCDPLKSDIVDAKAYLEEVKEFLECYLFNSTLEEFLDLQSVIDIMDTNSTLDKAIYYMKESGFNRIGQSYDKFLVLGGKRAKKSIKTTVYNADIKYVTESLEGTFFKSKERGFTYSKSALYKGNYYETGPLARAIISKDGFIKDCHRRCKDSVLTRILSRVREIAKLTLEVEDILNTLDISQKSMNSPKFIPKNITSFGKSATEAARGSLIHDISVKNGYIEKYDIITPTVWNLGNGTKENPSTIQKAIIGLDSIEKADFVFKSFDICSVCTTH